MQNLLKKIKNIIKTIYYYVPPCPMCKSPITGHFVSLKRDTISDWQINECLKHGELVQPVHEIGSKNCYCLNCGCHWKGDVETKILTWNEIEHEKDKRLTREILNERIHMEREELRKDHSILKPFKRFVGKL